MTSSNDEFDLSTLYPFYVEEKLSSPRLFGDTNEFLKYRKANPVRIQQEFEAIAHTEYKIADVKNWLSREITKDRRDRAYYRNLSHPELADTDTANSEGVTFYTGFLSGLEQLCDTWLSVAELTKIREEHAHRLAASGKLDLKQLSYDIITDVKENM